MDDGFRPVISACSDASIWASTAQQHGPAPWLRYLTQVRKDVLTDHQR